MRSLKKVLSACLLSLPLIAANTASAQAFPDKPIRWLVPYPAGGGSDFLARTIGQTLSANVGQPVLVENKPGGNTAIAAADLARAKPDGYTVLSADNGTLVFNTALYKSLSYDAAKDLKPVTLMGRFPMILVVDPASGINSVKDFIEKGKAQPENVNYGSAGAGSPHHLAMELLKEETGLKIMHIPYRGAAPALVDVAGGQVQGMMVDLAAGAALIKSAKVKPLAVANPTRLAQLPDVPTFAELGYPNIEAAALVGVVVPGGTPDDTVAALNQQIVAVVKTPSVHQRLLDFGIEPVGNTAAEYDELLKNERTRWHKLIRDLNITLD